MYHLIDFCRLCLSLKGEFTDMWVDDIMEKVTACISELDFDSNLPLLICDRCLEKMEEFFEFRNQCLQSEFFINGYVDKLLNGTMGGENFMSSVLKVNVIKDFGTSKKYKSNVRLRKKRQRRPPNKCDSSTKTDLPESLESNNCSSVIGGDQPPVPIPESVVVQTLEIEDAKSLNAKDYIPSILDSTDDNDVFIEEEEDYNITESSAPLESTSEDAFSPNQAQPINLELYDPEHLLMNNGQARANFDVQTDVSERVKLRQRSTRTPKPVYRLDTTHVNKTGNGTAKKSTSGSKKPLKKPKTPDDVVPKSQARKSTSKSWSNIKKGRVKISSASRELWKAACRNWTLQRMQTSGPRNSPGSVKPNPCPEPRKESPVEIQPPATAVETSVECRENNPEQSCTGVKPRMPRIKTVQELNALLEQQHQRFSENLSSEYGIVMDDDHSNSEQSDSQWSGIDDMVGDKGPQILNTFSLSGDIWDENVDCPSPTPGVISTTQVNLLQQKIQVSHPNGTTKTEIVVDTDPFKILYEQPNCNTADQPSSYNTLQDGTTHELNDSDIPAAKSLPVRIPLKQKVSVKPLSSLKQQRNTTQYKIKTTNNIILIDGDKIPPAASGEEKKLYKNNFGNILQHYLSNSDATTTKTTNVSYTLNPIKLLLPRKHPQHNVKLAPSSIKKNLHSKINPPPSETLKVNIPLTSLDQVEANKNKSWNPDQDVKNIPQHTTLRETDPDVVYINDSPEIPLEELENTSYFSVTPNAQLGVTQSSTPRRGNKRPPSCNEISPSKSKRASSEESDNLVIDESLNTSKSPEKSFTEDDVKSFIPMDQKSPTKRLTESERLLQDLATTENKDPLESFDLDNTPLVNSAVASESALENTASDSDSSYIDVEAFSDDDDDDNSSLTLDYYIPNDLAYNQYTKLADKHRYSEQIRRQYLRQCFKDLHYVIGQDVRRNNCRQILTDAREMIEHLESRSTLLGKQYAYLKRKHKIFLNIISELKKS